MDNLDNAQRDHQKNRSDIVNLVKQMFALDKWGDEQYRKELLALVERDQDLIKRVTMILKKRQSARTPQSGEQ